jgi:predicted small secreted protein
MKTVLTALALLSLAACNTRSGQDTGRVGGESADTTVTTRQMQDTTIVTSDTTVHTDTTTHKGDKPVNKDTAKSR